MNLYIAATRQNDGKTMISLGLLSALRKCFSSVTYMKPVGQQYKIVNGEKIDKDVILMEKVYGFKNNLIDMSPIAIAQGFTEEYILKGDRSALIANVKNSYDRLAANNEFVLIEGTGHAGVGSVFDMSNADVASILGAKVVIVSCGGVGKPIDEIMLNIAKFQTHGVEVLGVIVNKVLETKYDKISDLVRKGLARKKVEVLGVIPFKKILSNPTVSEILEDLDGELVCGKNGLNKVAERFIIGDVAPHEILDSLCGGTLLIAPGNREDFIFSALSGWVLGITQKYQIAGIIATYGKRPSNRVLDIVERANIPLIVVNEDCFTTASKISSMIFKLRAEDEAKIKETAVLVEKYVDVDKLLNLVKNSPTPTVLKRP